MATFLTSTFKSNSPNKLQKMNLRHIGHPQSTDEFKHNVITDTLRHSKGVEVLLKDHVPDDNAENVMGIHPTYGYVDKLHGGKSVYMYVSA